MRRKESYVPERGDAVWITLNGEASRQPALVLSPAAYNGRVGLALMCPITSQAKGYPFEVKLPAGFDVSGVVLADQVRNLDWRACKVAMIDQVPREVIELVLRRLQPLVSGG